jgi:hypothetical protein
VHQRSDLPSSGAHPTGSLPQGLDPLSGGAQAYHAPLLNGDWQRPEAGLGLRACASVVGSAVWWCPSYRAPSSMVAGGSFVQAARGGTRAACLCASVARSVVWWWPGLPRVPPRWWLVAALSGRSEARLGLCACASTAGYFAPLPRLHPCGHYHSWFLLWCRLMVEFLAVLVCAFFLLALVCPAALDIVVVVSRFS